MTNETDTDVVEDRGQDGSKEIRISAIMPVFNGESFLPRSLPPLVDMASKGEVIEVIMVDDGSTDRSAELARSLGAQVIPTGGRTGVGAARNLAAEAARGDILWYVDADVVVHENAARLIRDGFVDPEVVAVFGSYDDLPPARNFLSQYKNLVHHYYHQRARTDASTFWAGCGAIRKNAFLNVGGFDTKRYRLPSIEDIELGYRLRAAGGRIKLLKDLHGTHLKVWRFFNLLHTEIFRRAIPWAKLMLEQGALTNDLNVGTTERIRAALAAVLLVCVIAMLLGKLPGWVVATVFAAIIAANWSLTKLFFNRNGLLFSIAGLFFHQLYYLYSTAAFAWSYLGHRLATIHRRPG